MCEKYRKCVPDANKQNGGSRDAEKQRIHQIIGKLANNVIFWYLKNKMHIKCFHLIRFKVLIQDTHSSNDCVKSAMW